MDENATAPACPRMIEAFGETKTIRAWARDPRCAVSEDTLRRRVVDLAWPAQAALTTPVDRHRTGSGRRLAAFGQWRTIAQWVADPRCVVAEMTLRLRLLRGWDLERALITPSDRRGLDSRATAQQRRDAVDAYRGGLSVAQVAARAGVSGAAVRTWLHAAGVPLRSAGHGQDSKGERP